MTTPRLARAVRKVLDTAPRPAQITTETVEAVRGDGRYVVRGRALAPTGMARLRAGDSVSVASADGRPRHIVAHQWRKSAPPIIRRAVAGVIEELSMTTRYELVYRNDQQVTNLGGRQFWGADIVTVDLSGFGLGIVEILEADLTWGDQDGTLLVTTRIPVTLPDRVIAYVRQEQFKHYVLRLSRGRRTPAGESRVSMALVSSATGPVFATPYSFGGGPIDVEHPYDLAQNAGVVGINHPPTFSAPLFYLTDGLTPLEIGVYHPLGFVPAVVGPAGILFTPSVTAPPPSGCWLAQWHDTDATKQRVLVWGHVANAVGLGSASCALWVERGGALERFLLPHGPTTGDADFAATVPTIPPLYELRTHSGVIPTSASHRYATWMSGAQRFIQKTVDPADVLWFDTVIRHYLSDLETGETIQIARYEVATGLAPFTSGDQSGIDNAAMALRIAHLSPGWLMQAKRTTQRGAIAFTLPEVYADLPTEVRPVAFRANGALSFDLSAWQSVVGVGLQGVLLPGDGRFDVDLFGLKAMPAAVASTLIMQDDRRPIYHVVPDTGELGRTSQ